MALEGSLADFGLADILQLIYFQRKTGILTLDGRMDRVRLIFFEGNISVAESRRRTEDNRLGKIMLKKGLLSESDLNAVLEEQKKTGSRFASILIKNDLVAKEVIREILQGQITETVIQIFGWKQGTYEFSTQGVSQDRDLNFSIDTQHLLMEGLRIVDEWSLIKGKITLDSVFKKKTSAPSGLSAEESEILSFVDGENDVSTIIDLSSKDNFEVSKMLLALMERGCIEALAAAPVVSAKTEEEAGKRTGISTYLLPVTILAAALISFSAFFSDHNSSYRIIKAAENIEDLRFRIDAYRLEHSYYPQDLSQFGKTNDPWGRPYVYRVGEKSFSLSSAGPDGVEGTGDDIN